jgi:hypothetical protein
MTFLFRSWKYKGALPGVFLGRPCVPLIPSRTVTGRLQGSRFQLLGLRAWRVIQGTMVAVVSVG